MTWLELQVWFHWVSWLTFAPYSWLDYPKLETLWSILNRRENDDFIPDFIDKNSYIKKVLEAHVTKSL